MKDLGDVISQFQRRIVFPLLKKNDGFPADANSLCKVLLGQGVSCS